MPSADIKNIVIIGGSCAAIGSAVTWRDAPLPSHRLIIIEQKSHFHHVYAFPRAAVKSGFEESLFVPYDNMFNKDNKVGQVIRAKAIAIHPNKVELDREVEGFGSFVPFSHLIYAAGTSIPAPGHFEAYDKAKGIGYLQAYQNLIRQSQKPVIIGGGAVGLELAAEIKDNYPEKEVTLIHSRDQYLAPYKYSLHQMTYNLLKNKLGVRQIMRDRVNLPEGGFPLEVKPLAIQTKKGRTIEADLAITCIGMSPNSDLLSKLSEQTINPATKFVQVQPTLQIRDERYPHIYAVGDVIESTDIKTGHYAWLQSIAALQNIMRDIEGEGGPDPYVSKDIPLIKISLGDKKAVMQTNCLGPLITLGSWIVGNSVPENLYADYSWRWLNARPEDDAQFSQQ
ncbi:hypothetical protein INT44_000946 [Umbelopsis vinacea]|uniref:FAD/NAD(P)-binding domain-containing protein n=1 Tax=Umbelopsis vinacea TaxID=44442 RepID=A0A8H7QAD9_9FUNG|nr:hypothetical protein INT44_000946 [Umbelopsis vinacea]